MQAKTVCINHGRLEIDLISIKNGVPICSKCSKELQFGTVKPRFDVNGTTSSEKIAKKKRSK